MVLEFVLMSNFSYRPTARLQEDPPTGVSGAPSENNIMLWNAVIFGWVRVWISGLLLTLILDAEGGQLCRRTWGGWPGVVGPDMERNSTSEYNEPPPHSSHICIWVIGESSTRSSPLWHHRTRFLTLLKQECSLISRPTPKTTSFYRLLQIIPFWLCHSPPFRWSAMSCL